MGVLEVTPTTLPGTQPNDPLLTNMFVYEHNEFYDDPTVQTWRTEQIAVNDCFFKNMNMYKYIVNIDIDEVIVPTNKTGSTWIEMMEALEKITKNEASYKDYRVFSSSKWQLGPKCPKSNIFLDICSIRYLWLDLIKP